MLGKSATQLLRLCGIIQNIKNAVELIKNIDDSNLNNLTNKFILSLDEKLKNNTLNLIEISKETVSQSYNLLTYFNTNKIILAGYDIDPSCESLSLEIKKIASGTTIISNLKFKLQHYSRVLLYDGSEVCATEICQKFRIKANDIIDVFNTLEENNLGKVFTLKGQKKTKKFLENYH